MKVVAKCLAFLHLSYQVHVKVCYPIPFIKFIVFNTFYAKHVLLQIPFYYDNESDHGRNKLHFGFYIQTHIGGSG